MFSKYRGSHHRMVYLWPLLIAVMFGLLNACTASSSQVILDGQTIFSANCNSCHTIGGGNLAGPDLKGITDRLSQQWLVDFITDPNQLLASGDPIVNDLLKQYNYVVMPNMGLTRSQILAVLTFIKAESGVAVVPTPGATPGGELLPGDPENGKKLFLGQVHLKNGGPFCIGCHGIDDTGILGGGTLGPNLTNAYTKYGDVGLEQILSNLPFLTMRPIFSNNSPTVDERADLRAFMKASAGKPEVNKELVIFGISGAGFLAAIVFIAVLWRNRLQGVRRQLLDRMRGKK